MMSRNVVRFTEALHGDFFQVHSEKHGCGWCFCVAWWVATWEGWSERSAEENRDLRTSLLNQGQHDGYLLYVDGEPVGWCQVGPRDRLEKLVHQFALEPDTNTWAITCFLISPAYRRRGLASFMLAEVLRDLQARGVQRVEAFPKHGDELDENDLWNGPESMYIANGFEVVQMGQQRSVLALMLM
ncbi:MAG: GNAT family N-acetyltransferase [Anaerolineales bacterium]|nr:GNAT family N-acetyltransferase [Anaerolineales bacterium]